MRVALLIADRTDFREMEVMRKKDGHYLIIKESSRRSNNP